MNKFTFSLGALLIGIGVLVAGNGLLGTLLAVRAAIEGFSEEVIGVVMAAYFLGLIIGSVHCVRLIERVGHIRTFAGLASVASASALAAPLFLSPLAWGVLRGITGYCLAGLYMVTESWLNDQASVGNRGRVLSAYMIVNLGAIAAGQLLLPLGDPARFELFSVASILVSLGLVPVVLTRIEAPAPVPVRGMTVTRLYGISPLGTVACLASGLALGAFWGMGPLYASGLGLDQSGIAGFMAVTVVGGLLCQWPAGSLSDHWGRRRVILALSIAGTMSSAALVYFESDVGPYLLPLALAFGAAMYPLYSLGVAHVNDFIEREHFVSASSGLLLIYGCGAAAGPIIAGAMMGRAGGAGLFIFQGTILAALALLVIYRSIKRAAPRPEANEPAVFVPRTTAAVFELDPRAEAPREDRPD